MTGNDAPVGRRFSHVYLERGAPQSDSRRMRRRLSAYLYQHSRSIDLDLLEQWIELETGAEVGTISGFYAEANTSDVLDSITLCRQFLGGQRTSIEAAQWLGFVQRVFDEVNLGYRIDEEGGVHYSVDEEYERNRSATVAGLGDARYAAAAAEFEDAYTKMNHDPPDTVGAVRSIFASIETLSKLIVGDAKITRLGPTEVEKYLKPMAAAAYQNDPVAGDVANQTLNGFKAWTIAAQPYRHGQETEDPAPPPVELAVVILGAGAAFLRWLIELERLTNQ